MFLPRFLRPRRFFSDAARPQVVWPEWSASIVATVSSLDGEERAAMEIMTRNTTGPIPRNDDALYDRGDPHPYDYTDMRFSGRGDSQG